MQEASHPLTHTTYFGTLFGTYFVFDDKTEMVLVDQHAAHERIRYEKLKKRVLDAEKNFRISTLLVPKTVKFPAEHRAKPWNPDLNLFCPTSASKPNFSVTTHVLFRSLPWNGEPREIGPRLKSLIERMIGLSSDDRQWLTRAALG